MAHTYINLVHQLTLKLDHIWRDDMCGGVRQGAMACLIEMCLWLRNGRLREVPPWWSGGGVMVNVLDTIDIYIIV